MTWKQLIEINEKNRKYVQQIMSNSTVHNLQKYVEYNEYTYIAKIINNKSQKICVLQNIGFGAVINDIEVNCLNDILKFYDNGKNYIENLEKFYDTFDKLYFVINKKIAKILIQAKYRQSIEFKEKELVKYIRVDDISKHMAKISLLGGVVCLVYLDTLVIYYFNQTMYITTDCNIKLAHGVKKMLEDNGIFI